MHVFNKYYFQNFPQSQATNTGLLLMSSQQHPQLNHDRTPSPSAMRIIDQPANIGKKYITVNLNTTDVPYQVGWLSQSSGPWYYGTMVQQPQCHRPW